MNDKSPKKKFKTLFIQIHLISLTWSVITGFVAGTIHAIGAYLFLVHFLAFFVYWNNLERLNLRVLKEKLF